MPKMCLDNVPIFSSLYSLYFYQFLRQTAHKTYSLLNAQKSSSLMAFYRVGYSTTRQIHRPFGAQQHRLLKSKQCYYWYVLCLPPVYTLRGGTGICDSQKPRYGNTSTASIYEKVSRYTNGRARIFSFALTILLLVQKERYSRLSLFRKSSRLALQRMSR